MLSEYFSIQTKSKFLVFEDKYNLLCSIKKNHINYESERINFSVYFENYFEIYVCFYIKEINKSIDLFSVVSFLNKNNYDTQLYKNQISSETDIDFVMNNLFINMDNVLEQIHKNENLLVLVYKHQQKIDLENYNIFIHNEMAVALNLEWSQKKYKNFIEVYEKYKNNERKIHIELNEMQRKQLEYSQKITKEKN